MKQFKRLLCLMMALLMIALALAACGGNDDNKDKDKDSKVTEDSGTNAPTGNDTTAPAGDETTLPSGDETTAPTGDATTNPTETDPTETDPTETDPPETDPPETVPPCEKHAFAENVLCTDVKVCTVCRTEVPAGEHAFYSGACTADRPCKNCSYVLPAAADHDWGQAFGCGTKKCNNCTVVMYGKYCERVDDVCIVCGTRTPAAIPSITIDGVEICEFKIVIPSPNNVIGTEYAKYLASLIDHRVNMWHKVDLEIVPDKYEKDGPEIRIGPTDRTVSTVADDEYLITVVNGDLEIQCGKMYSYAGLIDKIATMLSSNQWKGIAFKSGEDITETFTAAPEDALDGDVRIMFHNVYQFGENINIRSRYSMFHMLYDHYMPDVLGMQEASSNYWTANNGLLIKNCLKAMGYGTVGEAEGFAEIVFYNKATVKVLYSDVNKTAGNYGTTSILFQHIATGKYFGVCNSHFAANSVTNPPYDPVQGNQMRIRDAYSVVAGKEKLIAKAQELNLPNWENLAIIVGGDYNSLVGSDPVNVVVGANFVNAREAVDDKTKVDDLIASGAAPSYINQYDYHGPNYYTSGVGSGKSSIDHCYVHGEGITFTANQYQIITNVVARGTADHCAHYLDITLH